MTIATDPKTLGPNGRPLLKLKLKAPEPQTETAPTQLATAILSKKKAKAIASAKAARLELDWLRQRFPKAFNFEFHPLGLNSRNELSQIALSEGRSLRAVMHAVRMHVCTKRYFYSCSRPGAMRVDLNGNPFEPVSEDHRQHALESFKSIMTEISKSKTERAKSRAQPTKF